MTEFNHPKWGRQFENFAMEMSRLCVACDIDIQIPDLGERVLANDSSICRQHNPAGFTKLRHAMMAFYELEEHAIERLGPAEVQIMLDELRAELVRLREMGTED